MPESVRLIKVDPVTGLPGYDVFLQHLTQQLVRASEEKSSFSMSLVDIDWFGKVNEAQGRCAGDEIIGLLARSVVETVGEAGSVYRYGGDALAVAFPGTEKEQAFLCMEEVRKAFEGSHRVDAHGKAVEVSLTVSCGVAAFPDDAVHEPGLIRKCSEALYRAKVSGRNKVCIAREEKMVTKTTHYTQGQLEGLSRLAKREEVNEAALLREALDDLLRKHNS